jgi:hypothetical protein
VLSDVEASDADVSNASGNGLSDVPSDLDEQTSEAESADDIPATKRKSWTTIRS